MEANAMVRCDSPPRNQLFIVSTVRQLICYSAITKLTLVQEILAHSSRGVYRSHTQRLRIA